MDYSELHLTCLGQEQHHFAQLIATGGQDHHKEQMLYWQGQRKKAAALWHGEKVQEGAKRCKPEAKPKKRRQPSNQGLGCVKTYPDLSQFCLVQRHGLDLSLRLWYILRQHNSDTKGDGWLTEGEIFGLSIGNKRQTRAWLKRGANVFWRKHGDKYRLAGLGMLCEQLDVKLPKACVAIPKERIKNLATFRAALFASWFVSAGEEGRVISQAALSELFGRSARTLRTWARLAGLKVTHNLATAPLPKSKDELDGYPAGTAAAMNWKEPKPDKKPNLIWVERYGNETLLTWKMPNGYTMAWTPGPRTTLQKSASKRAPGLRGSGANVKIYYRRGAKGGTVARAMQRGGPVYLETGNQHKKAGAQLWARLA